MVQDVIASLRLLGPVDVTNLPGVEENVEFRLPVELHAF
jgi:4-hydroxy-3-methylbut-2-en-1-yl diphosphate reductase